MTQEERAALRALAEDATRASEDGSVPHREWRNARDMFLASANPAAVLALLAALDAAEAERATLRADAQGLREALAAEKAREVWYWRTGDPENTSDDLSDLLDRDDIAEIGIGQDAGTIWIARIPIQGDPDDTEINHFVTEAEARAALAAANKDASDDR